MNLFISIGLAFVHLCYSLSPQQYSDMMSIFQELESYQLIQNFPQNRIASLQISELRKEHDIHPSKPIFSLDFLKNIKAITTQCQDNPQEFTPLSPETQRDSKQYLKLCQNIIDLTSKLKNDIQNDILAFYLKRSFDSLIYLATSYNCYEKTIYKQKFEPLLSHLSQHPFWKKINPLKNNHILQVIPKADENIEDYILEGLYNPLLMRQIPQYIHPIRQKKYTIIIPSSLHGYALFKDDQRITTPFLTYYCRIRTPISSPRRRTKKNSLHALFSCRYSHAKNFRKPAFKTPPSTHTIRIMRIREYS